MTIQIKDLYQDVHRLSSPDGTIPVRRREGFYRNGAKRAFDVVVVVLGGLAILPALAVIALLVARDGGSPIYWSPRVGRGGRVFRMMKFRTMVKDADARLAAVLESDPVAAAEWARTQKLKRDPRITRFGRFLRRTSLDELPQIWNVLSGDMSLVGPRPMLPEQRAIYPGLAYYALRPGITGPWQVSDRNESEFAKRAEYDRDYEAGMSFGGDVRLMARTVRAVTRATGY